MGQRVRIAGRARAEAYPSQKGAPRNHRRTRDHYVMGRARYADRVGAAGGAFGEAAATTPKRE